MRLIILLLALSGTAQACTPPAPAVEDFSRAEVHGGELATRIDGQDVLLNLTHGTWRIDEEPPVWRLPARPQEISRGNVTLQYHYGPSGDTCYNESLVGFSVETAGAVRSWGAPPGVRATHSLESTLYVMDTWFSVVEWDDHRVLVGDWGTGSLEPAAVDSLDGFEAYDVEDSLYLLRDGEGIEIGPSETRSFLMPEGQVYTLFATEPPTARAADWLWTLDMPIERAILMGSLPSGIVLADGSLYLLNTTLILRYDGIINFHFATEHTIVQTFDAGGLGALVVEQRPDEGPVAHGVLLPDGRFMVKDFYDPDARWHEEGQGPVEEVKESPAMVVAVLVGLLLTLRRR